MAKISKSQLIKLQNKYGTDQAIGELFGISRQAVHQLRGKYGIPYIKDKNTSRNSDIVKSFEKGASVAKIAQKCKLSVSQTYRIIRDEKT
jgi:DNA invertase Pin-like site-specific DNA recombinase